MLALPPCEDSRETGVGYGASIQEEACFDSGAYRLRDTGGFNVVLLMKSCPFTERLLVAEIIGQMHPASPWLPTAPIPSIQDLPSAKP